ncbi:MAG: SDR family oxidoreductase [Burkholderiales bacterium]|nr:SDR family oxidoreductase [Burkholderiales bacterium]
MSPTLEHSTDPQPASEATLRPPPESFARHYRGNDRLSGKVAIITGGDSGIGRATAICFAKEGADVAISYLDEHDDAQATADAISRTGRRCLLFAGDIGVPRTAEQLVEKTIEAFGGIDILVNNAAEQHVREDIGNVSRDQVEQTFRTNVFAAFDLCRLVVPLMGEGACIINNVSVTAYRGSAHLVDYAASKGALVSMTRSLAQQLGDRKIRVNAVAPGPVWTALVAATFDGESLARFGEKTFLGRPAQPDEIAPCFVFLASEDASYMTGQVLHPNGGEAVES